MKYLLYTFFLSFWHQSVTTHDVAIAFFNISETEEGIDLNISFDKEDFLNSNNLKVTELSLDNVESYLIKNIDFLFNSYKTSYQVLEVNVVKDHIKIKGSFAKLDHKITSIEINNTCLIDIKKHSNVIEIDVNKESKSFRMHKERTKIHVEY